MNVELFLKKNVKPATGCTEPVAVGYATSLAYSAVHGKLAANPEGIEIIGIPPEAELDRVEGITIKTDRDVYKNALAVSIPGTYGQKGMAIASAMGLYSDPRNGLNLFQGVSPDTVAKANQVLTEHKVSIDEVTDNSENARLDIEVTLNYRADGKGKEAYVRLLDNHDNIAWIRVNGDTLYQPAPKQQIASQQEELPHTLEEMLSIVRKLSPKEKDLLYQGVEMNMAMAQEGLSQKYGLGVGASFQALLTEGTLNDDLITRVRINSAAAGDARMGGANMAVMSTAGSGNQGITALIPIAVTAEYFGIGRDRVCEAVMLSHLVTKLASTEAGYLSAICGCAIKAGSGAAAGVAYLLGGDEPEINNAINLMCANVTGMICDGAKEGCALKLSTAAGTATESALMAMHGVRVNPDNGIIFNRSENTLHGIGAIAHSMVGTDLTIVELMQNKC